MVLEKDDYQNQAEKNTSSAKKKESRLIVAFLFLGTVALSSLLWLKQGIKDWWKSIFKPTTYQVVKNDEEKLKNLETLLGFKPDLKDLKGLERSISLLVEDLSGTFGVYFYQLDKEQALGIDQGKSFTAASVNKLPIMVSFYQAVEKGEINEEEKYILKSKDVQDYGTGSLRYQQIGTSYTLDKLIQLTGKESDNTAAYVLEKLIGRETIQAGLDKLEMTKTSMRDNTTSPEEMGQYLVKLYRGELVSSVNKEKILTALTATDFEERIPQGVPQGIDVAHKIGNEVQVFNDCGLVLSSRPYVLCLLSKEASQDEALEVIPKISRLVWEFNSQ